MPSCTPPRRPRHTPTLRILTAAFVAGGLGAALASGPADARLIPAPGPWPSAVSGAANPLVGTASFFNGSNATTNASLRVWLPSQHRRRTAVTRTVGDSTVIRGRLRNRDTGRAIGGATLTLAAQNVYDPVAWAAVTTVQTSRRGTFRAVLGPGHHRRAALLYYPDATTTAPLYSRRLLIRARSRVTLERPFHRRRSYRFSGQVSAGSLPVAWDGLLIGLQVRNSQGNWITARLARAAPTGRFRIRYRFPRSGALKVRVILPAQPALALYAGYSRRWTIHPR
jgi:hypothetical protein